MDENLKLLQRIVAGKPTVQMKQYEKDYMERRVQLNYHGRYPYILDKEVKSSKDEPL